MQIRDYMKQLFQSFDLDKEVEITTDMLLSRADLIREIAEKCQSTKMFQYSKEQVGQFLRDLEQDSEVEDRLLHSWNWLMNRIAMAPTSFHMDGAVILTMPIVAHYLPSDS